MRLLAFAFTIVFAWRGPEGKWKCDWVQINASEINRQLSAGGHKKRATSSSHST